MVCLSAFATPTTRWGGGCTKRPLQMRCSLEARCAAFVKLWSATPLSLSSFL